MVRAGHRGEPVKRLRKLVDEAGRNSVCAGEYGHLYRAINKALELAAKECEVKVDRDGEYGGRWGGYGNFKGDMTGPECAKAIRGMKIKLESWE
jgi:hypothetical protein